MVPARRYERFQLIKYSVLLLRIVAPLSPLPTLTLHLTHHQSCHFVWSSAACHFTLCEPEAAAHQLGGDSACH